MSIHGRVYQVCSSCIMDTTDEDIYFDEQGVCNYCIRYKNYVSNFMKTGKEAEHELDKMVNKLKKQSRGDYDCIMGLSGGVDSSYLAWFAVKKLGLKPLIVHVDSGWNSELAVSNIENIVNRLNLDLHTLVLDWDEIRDLQRAFFKASVPNCDIPQDYAFITGLYQEATKYNIKSILNGGNMSTESILPTSWGYSASDLIHLRDIHKRFGTQRLKNFPVTSYWAKTFMLPYLKGLKVYRPLELINYTKQGAKDLLINEMGWRDYGGKHYESTFTKFFQAYYLPVKFGFDKRRAHLSSLIVSGQMTREDALTEMETPLYEPNQLKQDIDYIIRKLGFSESEWKGIMDAPPLKHEIYKTEEAINTFVQKVVFKPIFKVRAMLK